MIESIGVTVLSVAFLIVLFGGGALLRRRANIDIDGKPCIDARCFYASKYLVVVLWAAMMAQSWGANLRVVSLPGPLHAAALVLWAIGFVLLFVGRFRLGSSFRIGAPTERTALVVDGPFRFSRNPMYVGLYATFLASTLYTLNPAIFAVAAFVVGAHHAIVLAEERQLRTSFGREYEAYCCRVRRYI